MIGWITIVAFCSLFLGFGCGYRMAKEKYQYLVEGDCHSLKELHKQLGERLEQLDHEGDCSGH